MKRVLTAAFFFACLIALWEILVRRGFWSPYIVPSPLEVARYLWEALTDRSLIDGSVVTMKRLLFGYFFSVLAGVPLGLLNARFQMVAIRLACLGWDCKRFRASAGRRSRCCGSVRPSLRCFSL